MAGLEFLGCCAALHDVFLHSQKPALIIGSAEISNWWQLFLREARLVDIPGAALCHRSLYGEHAPLSRSVEHRFVLFDLDFAEAVHAIHVVHAVHQKILPHVDRVITYAHPIDVRYCSKSGHSLSMSGERCKKRTPSAFCSWGSTFD